LRTLPNRIALRRSLAPNSPQVRRSSGVTTRAERIRETTALPKTDSAYMLTADANRRRARARAEAIAAEEAAAAGGGASSHRGGGGTAAPETLAQLTRTLDEILRAVHSVNDRVSRIEDQLGARSSERHNSSSSVHSPIVNVQNLPPLLQNNADL
jgi:hypothetical protein